MKKVILMFVLAFLGMSSFAQDFDKVKNNLVLRKPEEAKKELDKIAADPKLKDKDKVTVLYWTYVIDGQFFRDSALAAKYPGSDSLSLQALYQYEQKDTSLKTLKENSTLLNDYDNLRSTGFANGVKAFNSHNWAEAYKGFKLTDAMDDFLKRHHFLAQTFIDTNTVLYAGYSAQNSGNYPEAVTYYKKLADDSVRMSESKTFENNLYAYLVNYYLQNGDQANFKKYLPVAKKVYPEFNSQWDQMEMQNTTSNSSLTELVTKYKQEAPGTLNEVKYITYAEAFAQADKKELTKLDSATQVDIKLTAADAYSKAYKLSAAKGGVEEVNVSKTGTQAAAADNTGIYSYNVGIIYYNVYEDLDQRFYEQRGESADLKAKRAVTEKIEQQYADSVITWFTITYDFYRVKDNLERKEKALVKTAVQALANIYQWKEQKATGVTPADVDKYDALYKKFDAETDKYSK